MAISCLFIGEGTVDVTRVCSFVRFFSGHPWVTAMPGWGIAALLSGHRDLPEEKCHPWTEVWTSAGVRHNRRLSPLGHSISQILVYYSGVSGFYFKCLEVCVLWIVFYWSAICLLLSKQEGDGGVTLGRKSLLVEATRGQVRTGDGGHFHRRSRLIKLVP